jgi:hypothetical protein
VKHSHYIVMNTEVNTIHMMFAAKEQNAHLPSGGG